MKKMIIAAVVACVAVITQAASTNWSVAAKSIAGTDGTGSYTSGSLAVLEYLVSGTWTEVGYSATVSAGKIVASTSTFTSDLFTADSDYTFRFVITDSGKTFTSTEYTVTAQLSDTAKISFGSQASQSWQAAPEPTSGLLLLLGMAGLALRRKQK